MTNAAETLYQQLRTSQEKYTYFILAAAASCIAFALVKTENQSISWSMLPLAVAVLCWGLSFFLGCRQLLYVNSTTYSNYELIRVQSGRHPEVGEHAGMIAAASAGIREAINQNSEKINALGVWQFRMLLVGGILYIAWHILQMVIRTSLKLPT
jgi:hypothetical protein